MFIFWERVHFWDRGALHAAHTAGAPLPADAWWDARSTKTAGMRNLARALAPVDASEPELAALKVPALGNPVEAEASSTSTATVLPAVLTSILH